MLLQFASFLAGTAMALLVVLLPLDQVHAAPQPPVSLSIQTPENPIPMWFEVVGDGVDVLPIQFSYDLQSSDGRELQMGPLKVNRSNFNVSMMQVGRIDPRLARLLPKDAQNEFVFLFRFPYHLMTVGTFEMISRTGRVLWSQQVDKKDLDFWQTQVDQWKALLVQNGTSEEDVNQSPSFQIPWGLRDAKTSTPLWKTNETFRFCYTSRESFGYTRLCTPYQEVIHRGDLSILQQVPRSEQRARVIYQNEDAPLNGNSEVEPGHPIQFYAELSWGGSYEFTSIPQKPNVIELTEIPNTDEVHLVAEGTFPLADFDVIKEEKVNPLEELFGWEETIGDFRRYWMTAISRKDPYVMIPGTGGGAYIQRFNIKRLPREELRPFLNRRTVRGTYKDGVKVFGAKNPTVIMRTRQNSVDVDDDDPREFTWRFGAKNKGSMNRSYLVVADGQNAFRAYNEVFKGYPFEISARLSGILGTGNNLLLMGELAAQYWFEDIYGWSNYYISRQRWGLGVKSFQALTNLNFGSYSDKLQVTNVDLKYRLSPGLWGRDETWGLIASYQQVKFNVFETGMLGGGLFWARSIPKIFDDLLNILPFMRYPKWVDFEFVYYMNSLNSAYPLRNPAQGGQGNWALNFHGQIMWTQRLFGEAGFGLKNYDFNYESYPGGTFQRLNFNFTSFYGTAGIGYKF